MKALPPLNAIRAFEAAARNRSFSRAANELHVTQGAISRHIKTLEQNLNCQLFLRHPQGVELTHAGEQLLPDLTTSFERITQAIRRVSVGDKELKIIAAPTMATRWLMPYLQQYQDENPDIRISASWFKSSYDEFYEGGFDIGIDCASSAAGRPEDLEPLYLKSESLTPVCSPEYLKSMPPIARPRDLTSFNIIHSTPDRWDWRMWFENIGVDVSEAKQERIFDTEEMAITAAITGMGVAIADINLVQSELNDGRLVAPVDIVVREGTGYYLFTKRGRFQERKIQTFVDWIVIKAKSEEEDNGQRNQSI
jgi:LysR family transcriptional regulator, glycine cleavage system transcriptional activator